MSQKCMYGFERIYDRSDLIANGWVTPAPFATSGGGSVGAPSINGKPGRALALISPTASAAAQAVGSVSNAVGDPGFVRLPGTVNSLWASGGASIGFRAKVNASATKRQYFNPAGNPVTQVQADGDRLYALGVDNNVTVVLYSDDQGITWTVIPNSPAFSSTSALSIANGWVVVTTTVGSNIRPVSTNDLGATWVTGPALAGSRGIYGIIGEGNPTNPFVVLATSTTAASAGAYVLTSLQPTGVYTKLATSFSWPASDTLFRVRVVANQLVVVGSTNIYFAPTATVTTANTWSTKTLAALGLTSCYSVHFSTVSNRWFFCTNAGLMSAPNGGTVGTPAPPSVAATAVTLAPGSAAALSVFDGAQVGNQFIVCGKSAATAYSTDGGLTWLYEQGAKLLKQSTQNWTAAIASTSQMFAFSNNGLVGTTTTADRGWRAVHVTDPDEAAAGFYSAYGLYGASAIDPATSLLTNNGMLAAFILSAVAADFNSRTLSVGTTLAGSAVATASLSSLLTMLVRYFEIKLTAAPTSNQFFIEVRVDGSAFIPVTTTAYALAAAGNVTDFLVFNFGRSGQLGSIDDVVINDGAGTTNVLNIGPAVIVAKNPVTDVQAQWTRTGAAVSNAQAVRRAAASASTGTNYLTASAAERDVYDADSPATVGDFAGYRVAAIQVAAYGQRVSGNVAPQLRVGTVSTAGAVDSAALPVTGAAVKCVAASIEADAAGAWTVSTAFAADLSLTKVA